MNNTYVSTSERGRGVFARHDIESGEIVESCPVLIYDNGQTISPDDHSYEWKDGSWCIVLGHGSLYNHSYIPNAHFVRDYAAQSMLYVSLCRIKAHDEILVNYNGDIYCRDQQWFSSNGTEEPETGRVESPATDTAPIP